MSMGCDALHGTVPASMRHKKPSPRGHECTRSKEMKKGVPDLPIAGKGAPGAMKRYAIKREKFSLQLPTLSTTINHGWIAHTPTKNLAPRKIMPVTYQQTQRLHKKLPPPLKMMPSTRRGEEEGESAQKQRRQQQQQQTTNLLVRRPAGKCLSLAVPDSLRVGELKSQLSLTTGIAVEDQYLMYQCKLLQDSATLALYGLGGTEGSDLTYCHLPMVDMGVRQRGGCFIVTFTILSILFFATLCAPFTCGTSLFLYLFLLPPVFVLPFFCL